MNSHLLIGISGASGAGKSYITQKIVKAFPDYCCAFALESYYKAPELVTQMKYQHDNPDSIDYERALKDLKSFLLKGEFESPIYDYQTHKVSGWEYKRVTPIIIIEGLFAFYDQAFRQYLNLKIWIEAEESVRYNRRIRRDMTERGESLENIQMRYIQNVKPGYKEYVIRCRKYADFIYKNNDFDRTNNILETITSNFIK